jgi:hypothetical protein
MTRRFNTAGLCNGDLRGLLCTERRLPDLRAAIDAQSNFVRQLPRQAGKTTSLLALGASLTTEGRYAECESHPSANARLAQRGGYVVRVGAALGWLMVLDQRSGAGDITERVKVERGRGDGGSELALVRL